MTFEIVIEDCIAVLLLVWPKRKAASYICSHYHSITFLERSVKVFGRVLLNTLLEDIDCEILAYARILCQADPRKVFREMGSPLLGS